ncbi:unnamed protein product [Heterobilharzia americana]|nr:unnamed protein product [Heterobilharzia americana]
MDLKEDNPEVKLSWEILETMMSRQYAHINYLFMDESGSIKENKDLKIVGTVPICLNKMNEKFCNRIYRSIREFVCDFRLMLLNCYRYNEISSRVGRCAEKLELLFEQKLQLLSPEIRAKTSIQATLGFCTAEDELLDCGVTRRRNSGRLFLSGDSRQLTPIRAIMEELEHVPHSGSVSGGIAATLVSNGIDSSGNTSSQQSSTVNNTLTTEENIALLVSRLSLWQRRRHEEELLNSWNDWWIDKSGPKMQEIIFNAPELLEAYQFLWLADPFLGISDCMTIYNNNFSINSANITNHARNLSLFDLEIGLCTAPRASLILSVCMCNLLATSKERSQIVNVLSNSTNGGSSNNLSIGVDSSTDCISSTTRRSRTLLSNAVTLPPIDYDIWERRLSTRVDSWYRSFWDRGRGVIEWATRRLGLSKTFFDVCGYKSNPLGKQRFHELSKYQQVMLLSALCESTLRTFENLRMSLDRSADWEASNPVHLGTDFFSKYTYVHFPNLLGIDPATSLRIYRIPYIKYRPIGYNSEKNTTNTTGFDITDVNKTEVMNESLKVEESEENTNLNNLSSNRKRKLRCSKSKQDIQRVEELNKHNTSLIENGLSVPGSVQRLPNWIHPSLARDVYRRWYRVTEQCTVNVPTANDNNSSTVFGNLEVSDKGKKRRLSERNSTPPSTVCNSGTSNSKTRISSSNSKNDKKDEVPFENFQDIDDQIVSEFIKSDPCLNPSPYASFNGPTRQFLSQQLTRTAIGGYRFCIKSHARQILKGLTNRNRYVDGDNDDDDDTESRSADQNTNGFRSPSVSHCESDDDVDRDRDRDDAIKTTEVMTDEVTQMDESTLSVNESTDEKSRPRRRSSRLTNMSKESTMDCSVTTNGTHTSASIPDDKNNITCTKELEKSNEEFNPTSSDEKLSNADKLCSKISDDIDDDNDDSDENMKKDEEEILEPPRESFTLVAKDAQELTDLISILRQVLLNSQEKLNTKNVDINDFNLDSDSKKKRLSERDGTISQQTTRAHNAIGSLERLIQNLEQLYQSVMNRESERVEAQRLARLRLLKDVEQWEENEAKKNMKQSSIISEDSQINAVSHPSLIPSFQTDSSKDRTERHMRREQLRARGMLEEDESDSEHDDFHQQVDNKEPMNSVKQPNNSSSLSRITRTGVTTTTTTTTTTSTISNSIMNGSGSNRKSINDTCYEAFTMRISESGNPKIPISRFSVEESLPKVRRSALLTPSKTVSILPKPTSCSKLTSTTTTVTTKNTTHNSSDYKSLTDYSYSRVSNSPFRSNTSRTPSILRPSMPRTQPITHHPNGLSVSLSSPLSHNNMSSISVTPSKPPIRKIYRVCNTLFTEDAKPVKIGPNGFLIPIPPDSIPLSQRQLARQMISRYHQHMKSASSSSTTSSLSQTDAISATGSKLTGTTSTVSSVSSSTQGGSQNSVAIAVPSVATESVKPSIVSQEANYPRLSIGSPVKS